MKKIYLLILFFALLATPFAWTQGPIQYDASGQFALPAGVTSVNVDLYGGGGGGGFTGNNEGAAGGGGGAFTRQVGLILSQAGSPFTVTVGAGGNGQSASAQATNGGESSFFGIIANGGGRAISRTTLGAAGAAGTGNTINHSGGQGGAGSGTANSGGGGGGASGNSVNNGNGGTNSPGTNGGAGGAGGIGANGGGAGGAGGTGANTPAENPGNPGFQPGGGGGGEGRNANPGPGGAGGAGRVIISFTCPTYSLTSTANSAVCQGQTSTITLSGLVNGTYTVTYNLTGANVATGATATFTVTNGVSGTFNTAVLANLGATTITITNMASGGRTSPAPVVIGCQNAISANNTAAFTVNAAPTAAAGPALAAICQGATSAAMGGSVGGSATGGVWSGGAGTWTNATDPANATYTAGASESGVVTLTLTTTGGPCNPTVVTKTITVLAAPTITTQPGNQTVTTVGTANFTVVAAGAGLTYQWQEFNGSTWNNVVNGGVYAGATTATLTITNPPLSMNGYNYRVIVTGTCAPTATTNGLATLNVSLSYCTPSTNANGQYINNFTASGSCQGISNLASGESTNGYGSFIGQSVTEYPGGVVSFTAGFVGGTHGVAIWVDWNNNGTFEADERVYTSEAFIAAANGSFVVPTGQATGSYRMRVMADWLATNPVTPCQFNQPTIGPNSGDRRGEVEDYTLTVINPPISANYTDAPFSFCPNSAISTITPVVVGVPTTYSIAPALPAGLSFDTTTGEITGTPTSAASGAHTITVSNGTCTNRSIVPIVVNPFASDLVAGTSAVICLGESTPMIASAIATETKVFNGGRIHINGSGNASPYPSTIDVSGLTGNITSVRVSINNFSHTYPQDVDVVLFSPTGANSTIFTNRLAGGPGVSNVTYNFVTGATILPLTNAASGTYDVAGNSYSGAGLPGAVSGANLNNFVGTAPNGTWRLFVFDDVAGDNGAIGGWTLTITTAANITYTWSPSTGLSDPAIANPIASPTVTTDYTVTATSAICSATSVTSAPITITVNPIRTVSAPSVTPTACLSTAIAPITHNTTGLTAIVSSTGLPAGVTASYAGNQITISGEATTAGTFNYTITPNGCGTAVATGTITIVPYAERIAPLGPQCSGSTLNFAATMDLPGSTYSWTFGHPSLPAGVTASVTSGTASTFSTAITNTTGADYFAAAPAQYIIVEQTVNGVTCQTAFNPTIHAPSVAPTGIDAAGLPYCTGGEVTLTRTGGSLATGAVWEWFSASCGGATEGTGNSIGVSPTANTTYFVRASAGTACPASTCTSLLVNAPLAINTLAQSGDVATCVVNSSNWIHFRNVDGRLIASVNSNGQNLGDVSATALVAGPSIVESCTEPDNANWHNAVLGRSFVISPTDQPAGAVSVRLYISEQEFLDYQALALTTTQNPGDNVLDIGDMDMTKHSGLTVQGDPENICDAGDNIYVTQSASGATSTFFGGFANSYYIEYSIASFSSMFPMNSANSPLPVTLTSFNAACMENEVVVRWTTASEYNASHYNLQSSRDGMVWSDIARIEAAGTTNQTSNYSFTDRNFAALNYYRLVQVDFDGTSEIYGPISAKCDINTSSMTVFPNPTDADFTVLIETNEAVENAIIELVDLSGRTIQVKEMNIMAGNTAIRFETNTMNPGTYIVRVKGLNDKFIPIRVVVM